MTDKKKKMAAFWVIAQFSVVDVYRCFRGACCLHYQGDVLVMEAASFPETSVNFTRLHGATKQKTVIFIPAAVRTSSLTKRKFRSKLKKSASVTYIYIGLCVD
jgi:hypothetical protein